METLKSEERRSWIFLESWTLIELALRTSHCEPWLGNGSMSCASCCSAYAVDIMAAAGGATLTSFSCYPPA